MITYETAYGIGYILGNIFALIGLIYVGGYIVNKIKVYIKRKKKEKQMKWVKK